MKDSLLADRLVEARRADMRLDEFPGDAPPELVAAYRVQRLAIEQWDDRIAGWKVGLVPVSAGEPPGRFVGPVWSRSVAEQSTGAVPVTLFRGESFIEVEWIAELCGDIAPIPDPASPEWARTLPVRWRLGVELCSSPIVGLRSHGAPAVCADFGINSGLVLGPEREAAEIPHARVTVDVDGDEPVEGGVDRVPGGVHAALAFAVSTLSARGEPLRAGLLIATGALTGAHQVREGSLVTVTEGAHTLEVAIAIGGGGARARRIESV